MTELGLSFELFCDDCINQSFIIVVGRETKFSLADRVIASKSNKV